MRDCLAYHVTFHFSNVHWPTELLLPFTSTLSNVLSQPACSNFCSARPESCFGVAKRALTVFDCDWLMAVPRCAFRHRSNVENAKAKRPRKERFVHESPPRSCQMGFAFSRAGRKSIITWHTTRVHSLSCSPSQIWFISSSTLDVCLRHCNIPPLDLIPHNKKKMDKKRKKEILKIIYMKMITDINNVFSEMCACCLSASSINAFLVKKRNKPINSKALIADLSAEFSYRNFELSERFSENLWWLACATMLGFRKFLNCFSGRDDFVEDVGW